MNQKIREALEAAREWVRVRELYVGECGNGPVDDSEIVAGVQHGDDTAILSMRHLRALAALPDVERVREDLRTIEKMARTDTPITKPRADRIAAFASAALATLSTAEPAARKFSELRDQPVLSATKTADGFRVMPAAPSGEDSTTCGRCGRRWRWHPAHAMCAEAPPPEAAVMEHPQHGYSRWCQCRFCTAWPDAMRAELAKVREENAALRAKLEEEKQAHDRHLQDAINQLNETQAKLEEAERERDIARACREEVERQSDEHEARADAAEKERQAWCEAHAELQRELDGAWKAAEVPVRGMVQLAEVIADQREKRKAAEQRIAEAVASAHLMTHSDGSPRSAETRLTQVLLALTADPKGGA